MCEPRCHCSRVPRKQGNAMLNLSACINVSIHVHWFCSRVMVSTGVDGDDLRVWLWRCVLEQLLCEPCELWRSIGPSASLAVGPSLQLRGPGVAGRTPVEESYYVNYVVDRAVPTDGDQAGWAEDARFRCRSHMFLKPGGARALQWEHARTIYYACL